MIELIFRFDYYRPSWRKDGMVCGQIIRLERQAREHWGDSQRVSVRQVYQCRRHNHRGKVPMARDCSFSYFIYRFYLLIIIR